MALIASSTNEAQVTTVSATVAGAGSTAVAMATVIPSRQYLIRLRAGHESEGAAPALRTLGEITPRQAQALLDALTVALDSVPADRKA